MSRGTRPDGRGVRRAGWIAAAAVVLGACGAPAPEEVITDGAPAQDGRWCAVLTDEEVGTLVGEDQVGRVLQVGELERSASYVKECGVRWADGADYVGVATARWVHAREPSGGDFVFRQVLPVLGEDAQRVADGTTVELGDGVFRRDDELFVWTVLEPGGGEAPQIAEMSLSIHDQLPGALSDEDLAQIGERMLGMTPGMVDWTGQARPLGTEDLTALLDGAEAAGAIGPWRGHRSGEG
ncbi:hypothetical protein V2J56_03290 [Georgenia sp. MJ206]|uniref:hypothetical protein n=1 Tax=Georgenia wangjunii TaxID=3117730 RepID=UPI002F269753